MNDRLKSVKLSRTLRNLCLCLCLVFVVMFLFLLVNSLMPGRRFLLASLIYLVLAGLSGYLAHYYHIRFRNRD